MDYCKNVTEPTQEAEPDKKKQKMLCDDDLLKKDLEVRLTSPKASDLTV